MKRMCHSLSRSRWSVPMEVVPPGFELELGHGLLAPHRSYLGVLDAARSSASTSLRPTCG